VKRGLVLLAVGLLVSAAALAVFVLRENRALPPAVMPVRPTPPLNHLEGSVVLPSGEPAPHAYVYAVERGGTRLSVARLDANGAFVDLNDCGSGCILTASAPPDLIAGPIMVGVAGVPIRLMLSPARSVLSGTVTDGRAPFSTLTGVRLTDAQGASFFGLTDDAGAYSVGFSPGRFALRVTTGTPDHLIVQQERVLAGTQSLDWVLPPSGTVSVTPAGQGFAFSPAIDASTYVSSWVLETGEREIQGIPLGPRTVWVFDDRSVGHADVEVRAGETTSAAVSLVPGATLSGRVVGAEGTPLEGAIVKVGGPVARQATADHDGFYRLDGLAPVRTEVAAYAKGFVPAKKEVDPVAAEVSTLAFTMDRAAAP
jgi:hypothetical protein